MKVTRDKYELPLAIADSAGLLARMTGNDPKTIVAGAYKYEFYGMKTQWRKVPYEEDDDNDLDNVQQEAPTNSIHDFD